MYPGGPYRRLDALILVLLGPQPISNTADFWSKSKDLADVLDRELH